MLRSAAELFIYLVLSSILSFLRFLCFILVHFRSTCPPSSTLEDQKRVVNMSDINPLMSAPAPKSTSSGRTNFASVKQEPAKKMTAAQIKKKAAAAAAHRNSGMNSASQEQQQQVLRQQQQRLLLLRHASKCEAGTPGNPKECPATKHCAQMKKLWSHIAKCKNQHCSTPHCVSSRYVLSHYHRCKDQNCSVCSPVRDAIQRHKDKRQEE